INLIGLVASLGVGGVAIAFASQKVIEQILWSIVLYIDRPFTVDDYIHLPDRNLGRVESVGWRSTKIRLSGKNTLVVVPNSNLAQMSIENLSRAKRIISIVTLTFFRVMSEEEKALIQNLIIESTNDILGIDHQLTQVSFQNLTDNTGQDCVQAQVIFFILGTTETTLELQQGLLGIAREKMIEQLENYGIKFKFKETVVDVTQPMNI
ncbi:MAG: mechanosensitive ion channel, partial [Kamptonema sp. SIO4C4]|nr:mechanosensitive ion channel [Kamptonema sp. SIO4C4]